MTTVPWGEAGTYPEKYEALAVPAFFRAFAEDLVDRAAPADGERVLDLACGTGVVARLIAERGVRAGRLVGADMTPAMIDVGRGAEHGDAVEWVLADGQELPFEDGDFDLVLCQQGLQFFPDLDAGVREIHRVLSGGGRVAAACWAGVERQSVMVPLFDSFGEHVPDVAAMGQIPFSMTAERFAGAFEQAGFSEVELTEHSDEAQWSSPGEVVRTFRDGTPFALLLAGVDDALVQRMSDDGERRLAEHAAPDGTVRAPMVTYVLTARRV